MRTPKYCKPELWSIFVAVALPGSDDYFNAARIPS